LTTQHFNGLTEAEQERLAILIEECSEVTQIACKILLHGYESTDPVTGSEESNRQALEREMGDLSHAFGRMETAGDIDRRVVTHRAAAKAERIKKYLHHQ